MLPQKCEPITDVPRLLAERSRLDLDGLDRTDRLIVQAIGEETLTGEQIAFKIKAPYKTPLRERLGPRGVLRREKVIVQVPGEGYRVTRGREDAQNGEDLPAPPEPPDEVTRAIGMLLRNIPGPSVVTIHAMDGRPVGVCLSVGNRVDGA